MREGAKQHYDALGAADDSRDADGLTVFSFAQAQERAPVYFARILNSHLLRPSQP